MEEWLSKLFDIFEAYDKANPSLKSLFEYICDLNKENKRLRQEIKDLKEKINERTGETHCPYKNGM